jgi:hypothetical protein
MALAQSNRVATDNGTLLVLRAKNLLKYVRTILRRINARTKWKRAVATDRTGACSRLSAWNPSRHEGLSLQATSKSVTSGHQDVLACSRMAVRCGKESHLLAPRRSSSPTRAPRRTTQQELSAGQNVLTSSKGRCSMIVCVHLALY